MLNKVAAVLTHRAVGPVASALAVALAGALAVDVGARQVERRAYEARIAELTRHAERAQALAKAQLTACHAAGDAGRRLTETNYGSEEAGGEARRLLERQPEGIDACARMESADQAVLSNLK
jgi:hypothetical protein